MSGSSNAAASPANDAPDGAVNQSPDTEAPEQFEFKLPDDPASNKDWYLWAGILVIAVLASFFSAAMGSFIWDDDHHVGLIPALGSLHGLLAIWFKHGATPQYYPLTFTSFWIENRLWQQTTPGYHIVNMLLHAGSAVLVWRLLRRLAVPGAWVAAAIWAVHPLQVESVAWLSERKNVLSGLFFFISIWFYIDFAGLASNPASEDEPVLREKSRTLQYAAFRNLPMNHEWVAYGLSLLAFALAMCSKTVACAMPAVMLVLLWWKGRKLLDSRTWTPLIPFFIFGVALSAYTVFREVAPGGTVQANGADFDLSPISRLLIAGRGLWFYVGKLVWPVNLIFSYPRHDPATMDGAAYALQWVYVLAAIAVIALLAMYRKTIGRGPLAAVLYYVLTLFPALGFINIYPMRYSFVADHFQYLSGLGLIVLAVVSFHHVLRKYAGNAPQGGGVASSTRMAVALSAFVIVVFCVSSWLRARIYESARAVWEDTVAKNGGSWLACDNLGIELVRDAEQQQRDGNLAHLNNDPDSEADALTTFNTDCTRAESLFRHVLEIRPWHYAAHNSLGALYRLQGRWPEALMEFQLACDGDHKDDPAHQLVAPYLNYATSLLHKDPQADIKPWIDQALALEGQSRTRKEDIALAHVTYGDYLFHRIKYDVAPNDDRGEMQQIQRAIYQLETAIRTLNTDITANLDLARLYERMSQLDQAAADRARAAGDFASADQYVQKSLTMDDPKAAENYQALMEATPYGRSAAALAGLGQITARHQVNHSFEGDILQDLILASKQFQNALEIDPNTPGAAANLAGIVQRFREEADRAANHEAAWRAFEPIVKNLQASASAAATSPSPDAFNHLAQVIAEADPVSQSIYLPLASDHPLRPVVHSLRNTMSNFTAAKNHGVTPTSQARDVATAAQTLIDHWKDRKPEKDAVIDATLLTVAYAGELDARPGSAQAWNDLKAATDRLAAANVVSPSDDAKNLLTTALSTLETRKAATQPTTRK